MRLIIPVLLLLTILPSCGRLGHLGKAPEFTPIEAGNQHHAMSVTPLPVSLEDPRDSASASLWSRDRRSLLGDRRAGTRGDIMTIVIEIDERAEISNSTQRSRDGSENLSLPSFFGIPQRINEKLPAGASLDDAVTTNSNSSSAGAGSVRRNEKLTLRVAATVVDVLQNGVLRIEGSQEVRVNFEIRELLVSGYVRPEDISRQNEITYDKIASARISYGGRGQISDVQQPRYGQQIADIILPF
ncbi:flagellar basal body L-ring protein FlgH [Actibacterium sp. 188UL27-1]|uniref:flagellar basal body L-ring protein FlgH n=1 Tax=Actibacterium sp. 188UL27-1 TaxID=2786961 RepID=UPI001959E182|nr:flagellar basal body L-ring protein FlgH [Actibacterium sp. 188UL27-1]MBM7066211.1 flagellar basal body L-ring protein FlgH [Actibacterium sp. 188UL27-1]